MKNRLYILLLSIAFLGCKTEGVHVNEPIAAKGEKLFNDSVLHIVELNFPTKHFYDSLVHFKELRDSTEKTTYLMGSVTVDSTFLDSIGVRIKGESSYDFYPGEKKSFKISFNRFHKKQKYQKYAKVNLNNNFKDPSFLREKLYLDGLEYLGAPAQKSAYAKLYINGKYWGVYLMLEQIDKKFLKRNFGNSKGNFYQGEPKPYFNWLGEDSHDYVRCYVLKSKRKTRGYDDIRDLCRSIHFGNTDSSAYVDSLNKYLNVKSTIKSWVVNNALINIDTYNMRYAHNFYMYYNTKSKQFEWINYDGNYTFGAWTPEFNLKQLEDFSIFYKRPGGKSILVQKMLEESPEIRKMYLQEMQNFLPFMESKRIQNKIDFYTFLLRDAIYEDSQKMYTYGEFEKNINTAIGDVLDPGAFIPGITDFTKKRRQSIIQQLKKYN